MLPFDFFRKMSHIQDSPFPSKIKAFSHFSIVKKVARERLELQDKICNLNKIKAFQTFQGVTFVTFVLLSRKLDL